MSRGWLIVFAKAPRPGLVKTRMSPPLSFEESAALYEAILGDVLVATARFAAQLDLESVVAFHPPEAVGELIAHTPPGYRLHPQRGADLAERMAFAVREAAAAGAERILIRGSDSPGLPLACFEQAAAASQDVFRAVGGLFSPPACPAACPLPVAGATPATG